MALGLLAGYFGIYAITGNDLTWQLQTSLSRLLVQVWPLVLLAGFVTLREPQLAERAAAPPPKKNNVKRRGNDALQTGSPGQHRTGRRSRISIRKFRRSTSAVSSNNSM